MRHHGLVDLPSLALGSLRIQATGPLGPEHAWARYTEPRRWSEWAPQIREVDYPHAVIRPGSTGRVTGPAGVVAVFRIDAVDHEARVWAWSVRSGPLRLRFEHGVEGRRWGEHGMGAGALAVACRGGLRADRPLGPRTARGGRAPR